MNCSFPPELDDKKLLAYLDGISDDEIVSHLEGCSYCRARADDLALLQNQLKTRLYRISCPSSEELGEYHLRMLSPSRMLIISAHLHECPHCTREVTELSDFLGDQRSASENGFLEKVKVMVARLVGGGSIAGLTTESSSVALRGGSKGPITLEADRIVIVLDIQSAGREKSNILGQVAADDQDVWTGAQVELRQGNRLEFSTVIDDLGAFRCESIQPGVKELQIMSKNSSVVVVSSFEVSD